MGERKGKMTITEIFDGINRQMTDAEKSAFVFCIANHDIDKAMEIIDSVCKQIRDERVEEWTTKF